MDSISDLFETRKMEKTYLDVLAGSPPQGEWTCRQELGPAPRQIGRMIVTRSGPGKAESLRVRGPCSASKVKALARSENASISEFGSSRPTRLPKQKGPRAACRTRAVNQSVII